MLKSYITRIVEKVLYERLTMCNKCFRLINKKRAKRFDEPPVKCWGLEHEMSWDTASIREGYYFCPSCAPAYDKVIDGRYYKTDVEVDERGKVIKKN